MSRPVCVLDKETRSAVKLGRGGTNAARYAKDPTTSMWLGRYAFDDDPDTIYSYGFNAECPDRLRDHVENGGIICAHNAGFEYFIWNFLLVPKFGWPELPISQMSDTAARVARLGIPRDLDRAAKALNVGQEKDMAGNQRMKRMAKPRKVMELDTEYGLNDDVIDMVKDYEADPFRYTVLWNDDIAIVYEWWAAEDRLQDLGAYCDQDVRTQMALHQLIPELPKDEWEIWQATMRANIRGCQMDTKFINRAQLLIDRKLREYADELQTLTHSRVSSHTDLNGMKDFIRGQGIELDGFDKNIVAALLEDDDTPEQVKRVAQIRSEAGKSSVAKYPSMALHVDDNGIAYDQLVYYGALATGRWSALGFQLQNLPARGGLAYDDAEWIIDEINRPATMQTVYDKVEHIEAVTGESIIESLSMCLRGAIKAREGKVIIGADFSNIEGRDAAWLGGEDWKLKAFADYDAGTGPDLYKVAAGGILGIAPDDVSKAMRNSIGKVSELALQFQGGVGAFLSMARIYRVEIADYWDEIHDALAEEIIESAKEAWDSRGKNSGIDKTTWIAAESVKIAWRAKHPGIVRAWYDLEDAAIAALTTPGKPYFACDKKLATYAKSINGKMFLLLRLPSGRCIHYANAKIREGKTPWGDTKPQVRFDKVESGRVLKAATYGGDLFQSAVQGSARDLMANGWLNTERAGYESLFAVHDEMISEIDKAKADLDHYTRLLCDLPDWAKGLPVTASGYIAARFRKD